MVTYELCIRNAFDMNFSLHKLLYSKNVVESKLISNDLDDNWSLKY